MTGGEVEKVGGGQPQVGDLGADGAGPFGKGRTEGDAGGTHVLGHHDVGGLGEGGKGRSDSPSEVLVDLVGVSPTDVVGLKDVTGVHNYTAYFAIPLFKNEDC